jgi:hypothetical protein
VKDKMLTSSNKAGATSSSFKQPSSALFTWQALQAFLSCSPGCGYLASVVTNARIHGAGVAWGGLLPAKGRAFLFPAPSTMFLGYRSLIVATCVGERK